MKKKQGNDLTIIKGEPYLDSRLLSERLGIDHRSTYRLIKRYKTDLEEAGQLRFEIAVGKRKQGGGNPEKYVLLNEEQSVFLLTLSKNTPDVVSLKKDLSRQFVGFRKLLHNRAMRRTDIDWILKRHEVKKADRKAMDMVLEFTEVAEVLGQEPAKARKNFVNTHKMIYRELFGLKITEKNPLPVNFRDSVSGDHLDYLKMTLKIANDAFADAMMCCTDYHAPYYAAREKVKSFVEFIKGPFNAAFELDFGRPVQMPLLN